MATRPLPLLERGTAMHGPALDYMAKQIYAGQAHWAGSGPERQCCGTCRFFQTVAGHKRCMKFRHLTGRFGAEVPPTALACKYHEGK